MYSPETRMNSKTQTRSYVERLCLVNQQDPSLFAGARDHVQRALASLPSSVSLSDVLAQAEKFRAIRQTKSSTT
jgi:hypothetical protein